MIKRDIEPYFEHCLKKFPVVVLTGPRQSGKTTLCRAMLKDRPYISFENPDMQAMATDDPRGFLSRYGDGAVFDEIQRVPQLLSYLQQIVDESRRNGRFILTGSHNFMLMRSVQQSLSGRVALLHLLPFSMAELGTRIRGQSPEKLMLTGFYPRIYDRKAEAGETMRNYVATYVQRDVREVLSVKNLSQFQKFLRMCAGRVGQVLNLSGIGSDLGLSHTTVREWLSVLEASYVVFLLPAYYRNFNKRLTKAPKLYFYDVGLASYLLGIDSPDRLALDPIKGALFENLALMEIVKHFYNAGKDAPVYYYRDSNGQEVDIVVELNRKLHLIEVKSGQTPMPDWTKSMRSLHEAAGDDVESSAVLYAGKETYVNHDVRYLSWDALRTRGLKELRL